MSPLARPDMGRPGALGTCRTHRRPLLAEPRAELAEQIATERLAEDSRTLLGTVGPSPLPRPSRRRGYCPDCVQAVALAAVAYLNGDDS